MIAPLKQPRLNPIAPSSDAQFVAYFYSDVVQRIVLYYTPTILTISRIAGASSIINIYFHCYRQRITESLKVLSTAAIYNSVPVG